MKTSAKKRRHTKRQARKQPRPAPVPNWQETATQLKCLTCGELVVIGQVGMTCGCGGKIQLSFQGIDVESRFPRQVSRSPIDGAVARLISRR